MLFYKDINVYQAAKERIRGIFDRHKDVPVVVSFSGGKDSTVVLNITKEIMDERSIKKIPVFWLDQEIESPFTVEYIRRVKKLPWVELYWVQSEYPKYNAHIGSWEYAWPRGKEWLREKEDGNPYIDFDLTDYKKFSNEYDFFLSKIFGNYVTIGGLHVDESPTRRMSLLAKAGDFCPFTPSYGGVNGIYYPLFDWQVYDIWFYIFSNRLDYCKHYDYMFSKKPLKNCRVGSFWNEQSHEDLNNMKEVAPYWYDKVLRRLKGANTTYHSHEFLAQFVRGLPPYFKTWEEYCVYLIENLTVEEFHKKMIAKYKSSREKLLRLCDGSKDLENMVEENLGRAVAFCAIKQDHELHVVDHKMFALRKEIKVKQDGNKK